jgi:hypothetical protein
MPRSAAAPKIRTSRRFEHIDMPLIEGLEKLVEARFTAIASGRPRIAARNDLFQTEQIICTLDELTGNASWRVRFRPNFQCGLDFARKRRPSVNRIETNGLKISADLHDFIVNEALPGTGVDTGSRFFEAFGTKPGAELAPKNRALLAKRDELQEKIDAWHRRDTAQPVDHDVYKDFLTEIGYLLPEGGRSSGLDRECRSRNRLDCRVRSSSCR